MKIISRFFLLPLFVAGMLWLPQSGFAASHQGTDGALTELRQELANFQQDIAALRAVTDPQQRVAAIQQFRQRIAQTLTRLIELKARVGQTGLRRGASGDAVATLQERLRNIPGVYPEGIVNGEFGPATERAVRRFQQQEGLKQTGIVDAATNERLDALAAGPVRPRRSGQATPISQETGLTRALARGSAGDEVRRLQDFLSQFPRLYPERAVTGTFGPSTEAAVRRLQERTGASGPKQHGKVEGRTREILNTLLAVGERNKPPKITKISAVAVAPGATLTIEGRGFTPIENAIFIKGRIITRDLVSDAGGTSLNFIIPNNIPCEPQKACPIKVVNAHGISNAHPIKLDPMPENPSDAPPPKPEDRGKPEAPPPPPPPPPSPESPPPAPSEPTILTLTPWSGPVGTQVTIKGSGFTEKDNAVNFGGSAKAVAGLRSQDGTKLVFDVPQTSCKIGQTCEVSVTNENGTSNTALFLLTQEIDFVKVMNPNGGETFTQGAANNIRWRGGTNRVQLLLADAAADATKDPRVSIIGWISSSVSPNASFSWDAKKVCSADGAFCWKVSPGSYKVLALSEDELGNLTLWDDATNTRGNWDVSDEFFTIVAGPTIWVQYPNGGEIFTRGGEFIVCWWTEDLKSGRVRIALYKAGKLVHTFDRDYNQGTPTGGFIDYWTLPTNLEPSTDYTVRIADATDGNFFDESDGPFMIDPSGSVVAVASPNGGESWVSGGDSYVSWSSVNLADKAVNVNLLKGGVFFRALGSNIPQKYWGSGDAYSSGSFDYWFPVPKDIPAGSDYVIEITDAADPAVRDTSNAPISVIQLPSTLTFKGRLIDTLTKSPLAGMSVWTSNGYWYGSDTRQTTLTNANGEFSFSYSTDSFLQTSYRNFGVWPNCYDGKWYSAWYWPSYDASTLYAYVEANPVVGLITDTRFPVASGVFDFGDIPFWPYGTLRMISDTPAHYSLYYRDRDTGRMGSAESWQNDFTFRTALAAGTDAWVKVKDLGGNTSYSPFGTLPASQKCGTKTLSYFNRGYQWEPYNVNASLGYSMSVREGSAVKKTGAASGGVSPYAWQAAGGRLPPGLELAANGMLSGTTTAAGYYEAMIRATDAQGVNAGEKLNATVLTPTGATPSRILTYYPNGWWNWVQGQYGYIGWWSSNLASKAVKIELWKGGKFYRTIASRVPQNWETGYFDYGWSVPADIPNGADYTVRVSDAGNEGTSSVTVPFVIDNGARAAWYDAWEGTQGGGDLAFIYSADTENLRAFKLYEKKPGDIQMRAVATFRNVASLLRDCTYEQIASGDWTLTSWCSGWVSVYQTPKPFSEFPPGEYSYQITALSKGGGGETVVANLKFFLDKIRIEKPNGLQTSSTPRIEWTLPALWPKGVEKNFWVGIAGSSSWWDAHYLWWTAAPTDTMGATTYSGPRLEPGWSYRVGVGGYTSVLDPVLGSSVGYTAIYESPASFSISP